MTDPVFPVDQNDPRRGGPPKLSLYQRGVALKMRRESQNDAEIARVLGMS